MSELRLSPSRLLLLCWVLGTGLLAVAVGKAVEGVCTVMAPAVEHAFAVAFAGTWGVGAVAALAHFLSLRYTLDQRYVTKASGILWRHRRSIPLDKITNIDVRQGPIEQILGIGQVWIYTPSSGSDTPEETLVGIRHPKRVKEAIIQQAEAQLTTSRDEILPEHRQVVGLLAEIRDQLGRIEARMPAPASQAAGLTSAAPAAATPLAAPEAAATDTSKRQPARSAGPLQSQSRP